MARHRYRKNNNNNRQNNNFEEDVLHNEDHNHHDNSINNGSDQTKNTNNKATNCDNITTVAQVANTINNYSTTTNDSEHNDMQGSEESNSAEEKMESLPLIANNDHIVSYNTLEKEHSNKNNACVDCNDIIDNVNEADAKDSCETPMQSTQTKQAINNATTNTTTNDATETTENDVMSNPQQTSEQIECTRQISEEEVSESCKKESLTLISDSNVVQKDDSDKSNTHNNLKHINDDEMNLRGDYRKSINESSTITSNLSEINMMNKDPSTLESTQKQSNKESHKILTNRTSSSSQLIDSSCQKNTMPSTSTVIDNSASTSATSADLANDTNTVNTQSESSCKGNVAENNQNESSNHKYDNKDARNDVESDNNKSNTAQNNVAGMHKIDDENESNGKKRCTFVDVKAAMAMKPRKSALRVNSPSVSQNCVVDDNSRNENNDTVNDSKNNKNINSYCIICKSNDQSISSSSSAFSSPQVQNNGDGNSSIKSSSGVNNNDKYSNSKDDSARSRRRIRFCDPVVTFQDDGTYSHYYSSNSNMKQRSSHSQELQENQSDAKNERNSDINNNEHRTYDSYDGKKVIKSSDSNSNNSSYYNIAAKHGKLEKEIKESSNLTAKSCAISNNPKEVCEQEQQIHNSHEEDQIRTASDNNYVNGVRTTNKKCTKRVSKSHNNGDSISKTEYSEINTTNNLNVSTDAGSYNGKRSSLSSVKQFVTLPHNRLSAATFAMLRERTIAHVQKM